MSSADNTPGPVDPSSGPLKPHKCHLCDAAYSRSEHLQRHIKSHNGTMDYACSVCGKVFARSDSLKRHASVHEGTEQVVLPESKVKRIKSCKPCATAKVKCGGGEPCKRCGDTNRECVYEDSQYGNGRKGKRPRTDSMSTDSHISPDLEVSQLPQSVFGPDLSPSFTDSHAFPPPTFSHNAVASTSTSATRLPPPPSQLFHLPQTSTSGSASTSDHHDWLGSMFDLSFGNAPEYTPEPSAHPLDTADFILHNSAASDQELALTTDEAMFWATWSDMSAPAVPPLPPTKPAAPPQPPVEAVTPSTQYSANSPASASPGGARPSVVPNGVGRGAAPEDFEYDEMGAAIAAWPIFYAPTHDSARLNLDDPVQDVTARNSPDLGQLGIHSKFDEPARLAMLETLVFARLSNEEYHAIYSTLSRIKLATYDSFVALYFEHFHKRLPFIHVPTFTPRTTTGFLLVQIVAIGAIHSPLAGSTQLGKVLLEITHRACGDMMVKDPRLTRHMPMIQSLMLWSLIKWTGTGRDLEMSELYRGTYPTFLRRLRAFDPRPLPVPSPDQPLAEQWSDWITWEERRRTAYACFILETDTAATFQLSATIMVSELRTALPCPDELWEAPTAEEWAKLYRQTSPNSELPVSVLLSSLSSPSTPLAPSEDATTPFGALVLSKVAQAMAQPLIQFRASSMHGAVSAGMSGVDVLLKKIHGGPHPFLTAFGTWKGGTLEAEYAGSILAGHMIHVTSSVSVEALQTIAGRGTKLDYDITSDQIVGWMEREPQEARRVALHAGQAIRILREFPQQGPNEGVSLFLVAMYLYIFSRTVSRQPRPPFPSHVFSPSALRLDEKHVSSPLDWVANGGPASLTGIGFLDSPLAPARVLRLYSQALGRRTVWSIGALLGGVLGRMADAAELAAPVL